MSYARPEKELLFRCFFSIAAFMTGLYAFITLVNARPAPLNATILLWFDVALMIIVVLQYAIGIDRQGYLGYAYYMACSALTVWSCNHYVQAYDIGILLKVTFIPFHFLVFVYLFTTMSPAAAKTDQPAAVAATIFPNRR